MFNYQEGEDKVYIPNEIFVDVVECEDIKSGSHAAFAYSYYWLISWLYRYAKYYCGGCTNKDIKEMLGYKDNRTIDYLIKKDGVLDQLGYTYKENDIPVLSEYKDGELAFTYLSGWYEDMKQEVKDRIGRTFTYKVPVKGIWRTEEDRLDNYENGTFYEIDNTHLVEYKVFEKCMSEKDLGTKGFYVYGYLKYKCQWHSGKYNSSLVRIGKDLKLNKNTVKKYIDNLKKHELLTYEVSEVVYKSGELTQDGNTYTMLS